MVGSTRQDGQRRFDHPDTGRSGRASIKLGPSRASVQLCTMYEDGGKAGARGLQHSVDASSAGLARSPSGRALEERPRRLLLRAFDATSARQISSYRSLGKRSGSRYLSGSSGRSFPPTAGRPRVRFPFSKSALSALARGVGGRSNLRRRRLDNDVGRAAASESEGASRKA